MSNEITSKSEILFLFDIENANPNGDPLNENRPRFDPETGTALVSDVRLKRTIRDYWFEYKGYNGTVDKDIFVRELQYSDGDKSFIQDGKRRAGNFDNNAETIINKCIDIRIFGGVIPLKDSSITYTGPVQFQMGRSLNKVEIITEQGTGAFASADKKQQASFRTEYKLPYALIGFNGVVNDKSAAKSKMTVEDKNELIEGIWEGTKNLISRSKFGQKPIFLLVIDYKDSFYSGGLRQKLDLISEINQESIRSIKDYKIDITELINDLLKVKDKITSVYINIDINLRLNYNGSDLTLNSGVYNNFDDLLQKNNVKL
ncbi:MAG: type I-B CRISPR-associated protein Cas7/Csh2 [Ignavibacteriaceae bacterium]|nr:type I-B CRISPR-associated protein Cas7/Csh2 [Ignavibacteriaceae bacterium]